MAVDPTTTKYTIKASIKAEGIVERPDIIGAIFGQTEGLLGNEMDMRDLQKSARIGRIEVDIEQKNGKTEGTIIVPSALEKVESAIIGAGLETIDRIGPAKATLKILSIEDTRGSARELVQKRAQELLAMMNEDPSQNSGAILDAVKNAVHVDAMTTLPGTKIPCGPNVLTADSIIIVEGRNDVANLLRCGIRNAVGVEGTSVPDEVRDLSREKTTTIFVDGDRGGELIAKELIQTCDVDFVARAPDTREVEELPHKLVMKCLKNKSSADQFLAQSGIKATRGRSAGRKKPAANKSDDGATRDRTPRDRSPRGRGKRDDAPRRGRGRDRDDDRRSDDKPRRGRSDSDAPRGRGPRKPAANNGVKAVHDPRASLKDTLASLSGSLKAVVLDKDGVAINEGLPVRELADTLRGTRKKVQSVIFDGVITQRLLDIAAQKSIATVVGVKMGNVSKVPDDVEILTRDDLN